VTFLALITLFLGYHARKVEMSYEYASMLPKKDRAFLDNQKFIEVFGEEGNIIIIGIQDSTFFEFHKFQKWKTLCNDLLKVEGVENLLSVSNAYNLHKNTEEKKFEIEMVFPDTISNQEELDAAVNKFKGLPFYKKLLYNDESNTYLIAITVNKDKMLSKEREKMVKAIQKIGKQFEKEENVTLHYSGLPYIRVVTAMIIKSELYLFSALALLICIVVLFLFFRSFKAVFFPVMVVLIGVIWSLGTLGLLGFKITILSGMIPSLLIVIGIPNSIYMMNKFHHEFVKHGNKVKALQRVIVKIGNATFLTNLTTALGFATFIIVKSDLLKQFGIVASLNILGLFVLSLILIPVIFSFIKTPSPRHVRHLEYKVVTRVIAWFINATQKHRQWVYATTTIILVLGIWGMTLMKSSGYVVDDIPKDNPIYTDLKFFEKNFNGLMPLEIMIDTKKPTGAMQLSTFEKIDELEKKLEKYDELSTPTSILNLLKFSKQAFYNGSENYYSLPNNREKNFILQYAATGEKNSDLLHSFLDSTRQFTRISIRVKDVGVKRMEELYTSFYNDIDSVFNPADFDVTVTGTSITVFKGTNYLLHNLLTSLALAIALISLIMALMFSSWRMVVMSLTPNIIPLIFTAAVMGFSGIPIKASTILVFSIAFGISVDNTIHFLAKYRQELKVTGWDIKKSVILALSETGVSMLYTSVVLFFGFGIFAVSSFGGTRAMGILVSLTLVVAVISNLILLPTLLFSLDRLTTTRAFKEPMLHIYDEEEDIELEDLEINYTAKNKED
jgi:predicted RND superfamily exporter protein